MDIDIAILAEELENKYPDIFVNQVSCGDIRYVAQWCSATEPYDATTLYYADSCENLPQEGLSYLFTEDPPAAYKRSNYLVVHGCADNAYLLTHAQMLIGRIRLWYSDVLYCVFKNKDIRSILDVSSAFFGNRVFLRLSYERRLIYDSSSELAVDPRWDDLSNLYCTVDMDEGSDKAGAAGLQVLSVKRLAELQALTKPAYVFVPGENVLTIMANIFVGRHRIASLSVVQDEAAPKKNCTKVYVAALAECLAFKLQDSLTVRAMQDYTVLKHIFDGDSYSDTEYRTMLKKLEWNDDDEYLVAVIFAGKQHKAVERFNAEIPLYAGIIHKLFPAGAVLPFFDHITAVLNFSRGAELGQHNKALFLRFLENTQLYVSYSLRFSGLRTARDNYEQALFVARGAEPSGAVAVSYSERILDDLIHNFKRDHELTGYLHPVVKTLAEYDSEHGSELLLSLYAYLLNDRSFKACASRYHMHRNTLAYRLKKIESLVSFDYYDENTRLSILVSARMLWYNEENVK